MIKPDGTGRYTYPCSNWFCRIKYYINW
jgi:hypothetical protein